jgi:dipeptidyl aminopeptidase/acylaminoacyl peptidase
MNVRIRKPHLNSLILAVLLAVGLLSMACRAGGRLAAGQSTQAAGTSPSLTLTAFQPASSPAIQPTASPAPSPSPLLAPTATPALYDTYTIDYLASRTYGGGNLQAQTTLAVEPLFTRTMFSYPSDGLTIVGFMNVPHGPGPFPVVIALHGYIDPGIYETLDYTANYADALAGADFVVLHPNLRGFPPSDQGDNLFRVGMAVDVLNLIALVKSQAGQPGPLEQANPQAIGLWGHSMGGGIATRVLTVSPDVRAAVLYAAMSGDERQNYEAIQLWSENERGLEELAVPEAELARISPIYFLDRIEAAVSIHHGKADTLVPPAWSLDLCNRLVELGKEVSCFLYDNEPHTFYGYGDLVFKQRVVDFFNQTLKP